jgi:hypothetical protein
VPTETVKRKRGTGTWGGARPGSGRKADPARLELESIMHAAVSREDRIAIVEKAVSLARAGSFSHAQLVLAYLYGKPPQRLEHTGDPDRPIGVVYVNDWRSSENNGNGHR